MSALPSHLVLAEKAVPRYTSYPTAPHFSDAVGPDQYAAWLADLPAETRLSLYLHVPFCRELCTYCGCHTRATRRDEPLHAYAATLAREIDMVATASPARKVIHAHWGGGTPGLLGGEKLRALTETLRGHFDFAPEAEISIELDPRHVDGPLAEPLFAAGFNRVSLGVQDFNPHVQQAIGRIQPFDVVERAVNVLRAAGFRAINLDLMYGLPFQTEADVVHTAERAASLRPSRLALFGYAHAPWFAKRQKLIDAAALPGAAERLRQAATARRVLSEQGYVAIGLDHFALPDDPMAVAQRAGKLRRNFQGYTVDQADALLPFGASSIGRLPQGYVQNAADVGTWRRAIESERFATVKGVGFTRDDLARAAVIERLMCDFSVDYGAIAERFLGDAAALDAAQEELAQLTGEGVATQEGRRVSITEAGRPFMRLVASAFDAYLAARAARHSVAV
ncbi:oxygen-independent coproporphyrinogen III oxidase [Rhodoblastus acidophilus]|uniref:Coproporphyrinogen-III oxidase n=1 Tax=Candidatus Rhodoblastus alkanivorans TaxID=2954117 RepID=A0ABS9ZC05_9HYPH|nr:oxygen-independent coproporphyrinogen III oxidase [Candidatus Rhodoblastus alkanivorans]MCI4679364.1 oxygen-independent coproporphyrinogen III oxidase [Candidatus Rhodoblastus alkanivorans]MCI4684840.1 oxygen-independent coproporphyrinogen III oxidase [Candidatus Rhodoblastus alkanivorans]MDI4642164.1 oxygen-independent coproporphyrinogen III oxidase [Rhodoblastus acidophilus]